MVKIIEMDDSVTLGEQFEAEVGAVILMNKFNVGPDEVEETYKSNLKYHFKTIYLWESKEEQLDTLIARI